MALGTADFGPGGHFFRLINSGDLNKYKFNQKSRAIHVFTFRDNQNPDRLLLTLTNFKSEFVKVKSKRSGS
jgi:hypothetical protein